MAMQKPTMRSPSKAPKTWPPILFATTKRRTGSNSSSSKPQISFCRRTASTRSGCSVSARTRISAIGTLGLLPERLHLVDVRILEGAPARRELLLHISETAAKLCVRAPQGLLRISFNDTGDVHDNKQHIAYFMFDLVDVSARMGLAQFFKFFMKFVDDLIEVLPVEPNGGSLR